jgi:single-strand DNA-binding protein
MAKHNEVGLTGNLGKNAEYRPEVGTGLATFSLAYNRYRPSEEGYTKSPPMWFRCVAWGDIARKVAGLKKGDRVSLVGRLESREWQDTKGDKHLSIEIVVESIFLATSLKAADVNLSDADMPLNRTPAPVAKASTTTPKTEASKPAAKGKGRKPTSKPTA